MPALAAILTCPTPSVCGDAASLLPVVDVLKDPLRLENIKQLLAQAGVELLLISPEFKIDRGADTGGTLVYFVKPLAGSVIGLNQLCRMGGSLDEQFGVTGFPDLLNHEAVRQLRRHYDVPQPVEAWLAEVSG